MTILLRPDIHTESLLSPLISFLQQRDCSPWLVGGSIRDLLLGQNCQDWDLVVSGDPVSLAQQTADHLHGFFAPMNEKASRVVIKGLNYEFIVDFASMKGGSIEADLAERDFTCNAIALPLASLLRHWQTGSSLPFIDPFHGQQDLEQRLLRAVSANAFVVDPLRTLRAVNFAVRYGLTIVPETASWIRTHASLLPNVAANRIHEKLFQILSYPNTTQQLRMLDDLKLFDVLFPELTIAHGMQQPDLHYWDVFDHSLETVNALETVLAAIRGQNTETPHSQKIRTDLAPLSEWLGVAKAKGLFDLSSWDLSLLKLASLLHDIGKTNTYEVDGEGNIHFYHHPQTGVPLAQTVIARFNASTQEQRLVKQIVANHMRPGLLSGTPVTQRAIRRFFVDLGPVGLLVCLVSLADHLAMRGPSELTEAWEKHLATVKILFHTYIYEQEKISPPRLVQGGELIQKFKLAPGPVIRELLELIAEAQSEGQVTSKDEALWLAEEYLTKRQGAG